MLLVACGIIFMGYFMQYQVSGLSFLLMPQFGLDTSQFSSLMFAPMLTAMFLSIPMGMLADRYGSTRTVAVCLAVACIGGFARVWATGFGALMAACFLTGFAPAAINSNYMRLFRTWFGRKSGIIIGIYYAFSGLGSVAALLTAVSFGSTHEAFLVSAVVLVVLSAIWCLFVRDAPKDVAADSGAAPAPAGARIGVREGFAIAARSRGVWMVAVVTGLGLAAKTAYLGFLPQAFQLVMSPEAANSLSAFVGYGGIIGCALGPLVCFNRKHPRLLVCTFNTLTAVFMIATALILSNPLPIVLFVTGFVSSMAAPMVEAVPCVLPELKDCMGSAGGIIGTTSLALSYVVPLLITFIAGSNYLLLLVLVGVCFLVTVPILVVIPGLEDATHTKMV